MFIGHFGIGLGAKRFAPDVSLGTLFIACQLLDLVWPLLVLARIETVTVDHGATRFTPLDFVFYPYSHSLLAALVWAVVCAGLFFVFRKNLGTSLVLAGIVLSHWVLDFISHRPDLPLLLGDSPKLGLSLWDSVWGTLIVETGLFVLGIYLYVKARESFSRRSKWLFGSLIAFLYIVYLANAFGPAPPENASPSLIAGPALAMWLIVAWGYWVDKRTVSAS